MKARARLDQRGIVISPDPEALARQAERREIEAVLAKPTPNIADLARLLAKVLARLEALEAKLNGTGSR